MSSRGLSEKQANSQVVSMCFGSKVQWYHRAVV